jgi:hypothetical protein
MKATKEYKPMRMLFELQRADNPRLYDDLAQFRQGSRRVSRLRTLATEGVLLSNIQTFVQNGPPAQKDKNQPGETEADDNQAQIFEAPLTD